MTILLIEGEKIVSPSATKLLPCSDRVGLQPGMGGHRLLVGFNLGSKSGRRRTALATADGT